MMDGGAVTLDSFASHAGRLQPTTSEFAFRSIGQMFWGSNYKAGFTQVAAPHYTQTADYQNEAARVLAEFWDENTHSDHYTVYVRDDINASSGGFSAFNTYVTHKGEATLQPRVTVRAKNVDGTDKEGEVIENSLTHELFHLRDIMGKPKGPADEITRVRLDAMPDGAHILFADIANSWSPIALRPLAMAALVEFMEGNTSAKTAWLATLRANNDPKFLDTLQTDAMTVRRFIEIQQGSQSLQEALRRAALESMSAPNWGVDEKTGTPRSYGDYYQREALRAYDYGYNSFENRQVWNSLRLRYNEPMEFVDIDFNDPEDVAAILKIGASFGPSPFEQNGRIHPDILAAFTAPLKPEIEAEYARVEAALGIQGKKLRGFSQALRDWGVSPQEYMAHTTGGRTVKPFPFQGPAQQVNAYQAAYRDGDYVPPPYMPKLPAAPAPQPMAA